LIVILNSRAQEDTTWIRPILEIFAARTAAELERLQALAELERHRDSLEDRVRIWAPWQRKWPPNCGNWNPTAG